MERRLMRVGLSRRFLIDLFTQGVELKNLRVVHGLPEDAILHYSFFDPSTAIGWLCFEHDSFDIVKHGEEIPVFEIKVESIDPE